MKRYFKEKFRSFLGINLLERNLNNIESNQYEILRNLESATYNKELIAFNLINKLLPKEIYFPITSWSISPNALAHILNDIVINKRKTILEFGPGYSTLVISKLLKVNNLSAKLYSIESDEYFADILNKALVAEGLEGYVQIIIAPLTESSYKFKSHDVWYNKQLLEEKLMSLNNIDLVLVDGPPGKYSYSRFGAIPFILNKLNSDFTIVLDDTTRKEEMEIAKEWARILNLKIEVQKNYTLLYKSKNAETRPPFVKSIH